MANTTEILQYDERLASFLLDAVSYRIPWAVTRVVQHTNEQTVYPICPRCNCSVEREYMNFCDRCGQKLDWDLLEFANVVTFSDLDT